MPARTRNNKRKRASPQKVESVLLESDTEVSFKVKRPRKCSVRSDDTKSSSTLSTDSGFKSNPSISANSASLSTNSISSCGSTSVKDVAIYYAKKSPAKYSTSDVQQHSRSPLLAPLLSNTGKLDLKKDEDDEVFFQNTPPEDHSNSCGTFGVLRKKFRSSSDIINLMQKRNSKGLTLDVEAAARRRKVENIIELEEGAKVALPRRSPNGYLLPDPLPLGIILTDLRRNRWKIGKSIAVGGFGEIYSAELLNDDGIPSHHTLKCGSNYVVKVEPHTNGPLFVEMNFYLRATKRDSIERWKEERGLLHLGVPHVEGSGSFRLRGKKFRFLVIPRYGTDLQTLLDQSGSTLSIDTACSIGKQVIDSYEYIHSKGYVHKDCKGSNILFINRGSTAPEVTKHTPVKKICLVDYGLISKYLQEGGVHKPYGIDERSAHEGTLEYTSRDAHLGCVSRRGDIEVLLYCLIEWLGGKLPWDQPQQPHPREIHKNKIWAFQNMDMFLNKAFSERPDDMKGPPLFLNKLMKYIDTLRFEEKPDYNYLRSIFLRRTAPRRSSPSVYAYSSEDEEVNLALSIRNKHNLLPPRPISPIPHSTSESSDDTDDEVVIKSQSGDSDRPRTPRTRQMDEANIEQRLEEEKLARQAEYAEEELTRLSDERFQKEREMFCQKLCIKSLKNPTHAMLQQINKIEERRHTFERSMSELRDSPFRRSTFVTVGAKRARSRSLVLYPTGDDSVLRTQKRDTKGPSTPTTCPFRKGLQRRKGGAVKRLFNQSPAAAANSSFSMKKVRRSRKSGKSVGSLGPSGALKSVSRRRHRSGPTKEVAFSLINESGSDCKGDIVSPLSISNGVSPFRRSKRCVAVVPRDDKQFGFSQHVQDFSTFFNKALYNVTKSILRYNSKS